jgi:hypothetical protein
MADPRVEVDEDAIAAMFSDWGSDVGQAIAEATDLVSAVARLAAPVSRKRPTGKAARRYGNEPGYLKANTRKATTLHHDDDTGFVLGLVGAVRYPYNFIANPASHKGFTVNRGHRSIRKGDDDYLDAALSAVNGFTFTSWP